MSNVSPKYRALNFLSQRSKTTGTENIKLLNNNAMKRTLMNAIKKGGSSRMAKLSNIPQGLVNTALKVAKKTRKGAVKVARRTGKGVFKVAGTTVNTTAGLAKNILGTLTNIGVSATRGVGKVVKNSVGAVAGVAKGAIGSVRKTIKGRTLRKNRKTRRNSRR